MTSNPTAEIDRELIDLVDSLQVKDATKWGLANAYNGTDEQSKGRYLGIIEALWGEKTITEEQFLKLEQYREQKNSPI